ncbi:MAG: Mor transcription activator family protein [Candidatus Pseudoruminococcus sp.]|uniref:Mor transcription activator family protein n=1 Tax=Candidatus Pseudoruminococcus sp. TaxID=3101048 RepID=UPI002A7783E2|nr:DNA-binding protein [Ruminococcus sp.]MDY2782130.1 Mor transcription activator family protein [Candidatus Pseudoruminococcus sp.]
MDKLIISLEDLSDRQREIAEIVGIENYIKLSKRFGGEDSIYIQKYSEIIKVVRNNEIRTKYNDGHNISELAKKYNLSERYVRKLCHTKI